MQSHLRRLISLLLLQAQVWLVAEGHKLLFYYRSEQGPRIAIISCSPGTVTAVNYSRTVIDRSCTAVGYHIVIVCLSTVNSRYRPVFELIKPVAPTNLIHHLHPHQSQRSQVFYQAMLSSIQRQALQSLCD